MSVIWAEAPVASAAPRRYISAALGSSTLASFSPRLLTISLMTWLRTWRMTTSVDASAEPMAPLGGSVHCGALCPTCPHLEHVGKLFFLPLPPWLFTGAAPTVCSDKHIWLAVASCFKWSMKLATRRPSSLLSTLAGRPFFLMMREGCSRLLSTCTARGVVCVNARVRTKCRNMYC